METMPHRYAVNWDNGVNECGTFAERFDTEEIAESFAETWVAEMTALIDETYRGNGFSAEVILADPASDDELKQMALDELGRLGG